MSNQNWVEKRAEGRVKIEQLHSLVTDQLEGYGEEHAEFYKRIIDRNGEVGHKFDSARMKEDTAALTKSALLFIGGALALAAFIASSEEGDESNLSIELAIAAGGILFVAGVLHLVEKKLQENTEFLAAGLDILAASSSATPTLSNDNDLDEEVDLSAPEQQKGYGV